MSQFQCFQDGKPCSSYRIPSWDIDTFDTKEEAELFCAHWAYPVSKDQAKDFVRPMKLNTPIDMGISEVPVMMEIRSK
jgi:hypothetical protein